MLIFRWRLWIVIVVGVMVSGCDHHNSADQPVTERTKPLVFVANAALEYFAQSIAGSDAEIWFPVPADTDPAYWEPDQKTLTRIQSARLILLNDPDYSKWVATRSLPARRTIDSIGSIDQLIEMTSIVVHRHGPDGEHAHAGTAVGTWLDPYLARMQAKATLEELIRILPDHSDQLRKRWQSLDLDLQRLSERLAAIKNQFPTVRLVASHPVYAYLASWCQWPTESMHWEPHEHPPQSQWQALDELLKKHPSRVMLWEDTPTAETLKSLNDRNLVVAVFHPLAQRPANGDWLKAMEANVTRLEAALVSAEKPETAKPTKDE